MNNSLDFSPTWASPPGDTIRSILFQRDVNIEEFSDLVGLDVDSCERMLSGYEKITRELARNIALVTEVSENFWLNREKKYRQQIEASRDERLQWLGKLPTQDMVKWNWIPKGLQVWDKFNACLDFFNVSSLDEWDEKFSSRLTNVAFRTSNSFDNVPASVITWLYQAEKIACKEVKSEWNKEKLIHSIEQIRSLTTQEDPDIFIPQLQSILSDCGVSLVLLQTPKGTRASGATFFIEQKHPILVLSFRHKTDDHFWFSLFHEIGHLILHGNKAIFIEGKEIASSQEECEANDFAQEVLVPNKYRKELQTLTHRDLRKIVKFAKKIGISKGIVVGQLQNSGNVPYGYLNKLKVKYDTSKVFLNL
ncbi:ImmA/IrrE family metallo-endopeptidase [Alteromonas macleodii]|uniref:IrrE N-terminal-like domain-containing protein n=1 Tax=Alteromonas macleodii (strain English Channel 673) TaxID=1004788 RepID=A0AB32ZU56_ALTME|nr:ImmA/IrrE family metallo-endopeptidase [Alteromonas macleodii]AFT72784.1 hypothetical protein AMEC673_00390 [Alteromonas macleodii str. 'English Channel 673']MBL3810961.1 ImmA/IrrE family metallo-endopeptidase [Alteromonas macleodii]MBL3884498.1 ImmA/IrrE family metallo-endopeptidase [Alteromonas macleodii]